MIIEQQTREDFSDNSETDNTENGFNEAESEADQKQKQALMQNAVEDKKKVEMKIEKKAMDTPAKDEKKEEDNNPNPKGDGRGYSKF